MQELAGSQTEANLKIAFARESEASRRYLYFAQQADIEGYPQIAELFRSVADGETGRALGHLDFLAEVGDPATGQPIESTSDSLRSAIASELHESNNMYPAFSETARAEGFGDIADWLETVAAADKTNADRFSAGLSSIDDR